MKASVNIAIVQEGPVYLDLAASLEKMQNLIQEAAKQSVELIVFGETWLSGYPAWLDHCLGYTPWDHPATKKVFARMYHNSVSVPGDAFHQLCVLARQHEMVIVTGINEVVPQGIGNGTIYNSLLIINSDGTLLNHHRKLMPTYTEKLLYGTGDGKGLQAVDTPLGRIGSLICWEHWMPLTRQAMHNSGEHIHIALWPQVHEMLQVASRHYAFEGRCFVIAVGQLMRATSFPKELKMPPVLADQPDQLVLKGGSCVYAPNGECLLAPQWEVEGILYLTLDNMDRIYEERMALDTSGHYNRNDVFSFDVDPTRK